jgi:hypothetical protein
MKIEAKRSQVLLTALVVVIAFQFIGIAVFGDYLDGFDTYSNGTTNPGPWSVSIQSGAGSCFTAHAVSSVRASLTTPNSYSFSVVPGSTCTGGMLANATMAFNASQTYTTVKEFVQFQGNTSDLSTSSSNIFAAYSCILTSHSTPCNLGSPASFVDPSRCSPGTSNGPFVSPVGGSKGWCSVSTSFATNPGTTYYFGFEVYFNATWTQSAGSIGCNPCFVNFDNMSILGGNQIVYPRNFVMLNGTNNQWYNIVGYGGLQYSKVIVNYTGNAASSTVFPVMSPDLQLNLASANLITVHVGNSYYRTIIPATSGNTSMYLSLPNQVNAYQVQILDPYGTVFAGNIIDIISGSHVITSGYIDSSLEFSTYLGSATYTVEIFAKGATPVFDGLVSFPVPTAPAGEQTPVQVTIQNNTIAAQNGVFTDISQGVVVTPANLIAATYNDSQVHTSMVNMTLQNTNVSGTFNLGTVCFSQSAHSGCTTTGALMGTETATFTFNSNLVNQYSVYYTFVSSKYGTEVIGPYPVVGGGFFTNTPTPQNNCFLGWCAILTTQYADQYDVILNFIAVVFLVFLASAFGAKYSSIGAVVVNLMTIVFGLAGWIPLTLIGGTPVLSVLVIAGAISYMKSRESHEVAQ